MTGKKIRRMTVKIGTRVLTDADNQIDIGVIRKLADQVSQLKGRGIDVIVVTSGAIGSGLGILGLNRKGRSLSELQAAASVGQNHLMDIYSECFKKNGNITGQILLTQEDLNDRRRFLNLRYTLNTLLAYKAVPIINENDSVSNEEIKFGDNDRLSSLVADMAESDMLVILTDVDGLLGQDGQVIRSVDNVDGGIRALCKGKGCETATGGMATKLDAVTTAAHAGIDCIIARGREKDVLLKIADGDGIGTFFKAKNRSLKARKRWIAFGKRPKGRITVDDGAEKAVVERNKSLLPGGVNKVNGVFFAGDVVEIVSSKGDVIAKGLVNYSSEEVAMIKGLKSDEIEKVLGYKDYDELIHRDNLVVTGKSEE